MAGSFRAVTRGNGVPIVKVQNHALWTALRTVFWPEMQIAGFCVYNLKFFPGIIPRTHAERPWCLDRGINFRLARQRSH